MRQVLLQLRLIEVNRTKLRAEGIEFAIERPKKESSAATAADQLFEERAVGTFCRVEEPNSQVLKNLIALRSKGHVRVLAEPTVVTVSGRPCQFNSGGEFPVPVPAGLGTLSIEYKKFGTQFDAKPVLGDDDTLRLELHSRFSELDHDHSVTVAEHTLPGLKVREFETATTFRLGQVLILAGLLQERRARDAAAPADDDESSSDADETYETIETLLLVRATAVAPMQEKNAAGGQKETGKSVRR